MARKPVTATAKLSAPNRRHPYRNRWVEDESRSRASYLATRRHLAPFLVPHRFEGKTVPEKLRRAGYGYGVGLNKAYLQEIIGHIVGAPVTYTWGKLAGGAQPGPDRPKEDSVGSRIWDDATREGVPMERFFGSKVLEWLTSSLGGFIAVDAPAGDDVTNQPAVSAPARGTNDGRPSTGEDGGQGQTLQSEQEPVRTKQDELDADERPYFRFLPWSAVEDFGPGPNGVVWIKFLEQVDVREPQAQTAAQGVSKNHILYELLADDSTQVSRFDKEGQLVKTANLGVIKDRQGKCTLPLVPVKLGEHPDLPYLGSGLLMGLDDVVIDIFNVLSETREAFRDVAFSLFVHKGPDAEKVQTQMSAGTRMVALGESPDAVLERLGGEATEPQVGFELIRLAVENWMLAARRQSQGAQKSTRSASSGVAIQAEFQLDLKPLLVEVTQQLDQIQTNALYIAAQIAGEDDPGEVAVKRGTDFRLEDEATRIARIAGEFVQSLPLTAEAKVQMFLAWAKATKLFDFDAKVPQMADVDGTTGTAQPVAPAQPAEGADGKPQQGEEGKDPAVAGTITPAAPVRKKLPAPKTLGEYLEQQARALYETAQAASINQTAFPTGANATFGDA